MNAQLAISNLTLNTQTTLQSKDVAVSKTPFGNDNSSFKSVMKDVSGEKKQEVNAKGKKTYAQIANNTKAAGIKYKSTVADAGVTQKVGDDTGTDDDASAVQNASDSVINGIAVLLGIDSNSLKQLMANLNIKPEDLLDNSKITDIVNQLSEKLGLSNQQQQVLLNSVQQFSKLAGEAVSSAQSAGNNWVVVEGVAFDVTKKQTDSASANTNASVSHLDEEISQLASNIKQANVSLFDNVPQKFASILEQLSNVNVSKNIDMLNQKADERKENTSDVNEDASETKDGTLSEISSVKKVITNKDDILTAKTSDNQNDVSLYQNSENLNAKTSTDNFVAKLNSLATETKVVKNEIMQQVVEQAKVLVDDNRSEMVMHLKPDSLGKLTLKLVTENGIVAAKIVAENQQVKQVLESNMQTLKDSLEKQGMSVQNVSVSVSQDGSQGSGQREAFERKQGKNKSFSIEDLSIVNGVETEDLNKTNPYEVLENSIDIIA